MTRVSLLVSIPVAAFFAVPVFAFSATSPDWLTTLTSFVTLTASFALSLFVMRYALERRGSLFYRPISLVGVGLFLIAFSFLSVLVSVTDAVDQRFLHDVLFISGFGLIAYGVGRLPHEPMQ